MLIAVRRAYLPNEGLDATGTAVDLVEGDLADDLVAVLPVMQCQWLLLWQEKERRLARQW